MRWLTALQTCLALLLAFFVAPFEHVHPGSTAGHDHPAVMHAHFYSAHLSKSEHHGTELLGPDSDDDDHHAVWSVDSFTLVITVASAPFDLPRGQVFNFASTVTIAPVEEVEERGHDPPCVDPSIPRAPPS